MAGIPLENPGEIARVLFGHDHWSRAEDILRDVFRPNSRIAVKGCNASSKCVAASEYIPLADGSRVQARYLVGMGDFSLRTRSNDGEIITVPALAEWNAIETVYAVTTESGRRIVRNADHPLWAADGVFGPGKRTKIFSRGWTHIHDLKEKMLVAVPEILSYESSISLPDHEVKLLAYMLGDGGTTSNTLTFTQQKNMQLDEFRECVEQYDCLLVPLADAYGYRVVYGPNSGKGGGYAKNPVRELLRKHNLMGTHSRDKRIPPAIWTLPLEQLAMFLSRLYATDGWASGSGDHTAPNIGFCSASELMIDDIQELLLRFGVCARKRKAGPTVNAWTLTIQASADILAFTNTIGIYGKEKAVAQVEARARRQQQAWSRRIWRQQNCPRGLRWERIVSIEPVGIEQTVAIEVPEYSTYLTTFWEHNTYLAADAIVMTLISGGDVLITAPTSDQVEGILWRQVRQTIADCKLDTKSWKVNQTSVVLPTGETAQARSTDQGVRFQGYHARPDAPLLIVVDEAPGVIGEIMEAIGGISAGGDVRLLLLGNPIVPQGAYYEIFERQAPNWTRHTISALENPNLSGIALEDLLQMTPEELSDNARPYLATRRWVYDAYYDYGPNSAYWYSHVLGEFPPDAVESLISPGQIKQAQDVPGGPSAYIPMDKGGLPLVAGIDVAGPGEDETVVCIRQGRIILDLQSTTIPDARLWAREILLKWVQKGLAQIHVDEIGQGWYFLKDLEDHFADRNIRIIGINVGERKGMNPEAQRKFQNLKGELYWRLRERFIDGQVGGLSDLPTAIQLGSIRHLEDRQGRIGIEAKQKLKSRGFKSPDRAEAVMLCFADGPGEGDLYTATGVGQRDLIRRNMGKGWTFGHTQKTVSPNRGRSLRDLQRGTAR